MSNKIIEQETTVLFAGDSGDGMQLAGNLFTLINAFAGNDLKTFPNYPAEIRAPQGSLHGISEFQIHFGSKKIYTIGEKVDVLIAMNAAALKLNIKNLKKGGLIILNKSGFDKKNLKSAGYNISPLDNGMLLPYKIISIDISKICKEALKNSPISNKEKERTKNMFVLGLLCWLYNRDINIIIKSLEIKLKNKKDILKANILILKTGYNFGETSELFNSKIEIHKSSLPKGRYRNITGNNAIAIALIAAAEKSGLKLFYSSYPITPASDILHELSKRKNFSVFAFQAEDEISAINSAIGASFGGSLAVTASSGPGMSLKTEAIGLAVMFELPLLIIDVQRCGPSTGMPTKTEQSDLFLSIFGRHGEAPLPVIAPSTPSDCFYATYEACRIAIEYMTPVILLSDAYLANGSEPWKFPKSDELKRIKTNFVSNEINFLPYKRNNKFVRYWAVPGMKGYEHRIGSLEKEKDTGNVSYNPDNHEYMVKIRAKKINNISKDLPDAQISTGDEKGKVLVISWGSTFGTINKAVQNLIKKNKKVSHIHLKYLNPLQKNLNKIINNFEKVLVPEINNGQLIHIIRDKFLIDAIPYNKIQGLPFTVNEIEEKISFLL